MSAFVASLSLAKTLHGSERVHKQPEDNHLKISVVFGTWKGCGTGVQHVQEADIALQLFSAHGSVASGGLWEPSGHQRYKRPGDAERTDDFWDTKRMEAQSVEGVPLKS